MCKRKRTNHNISLIYLILEKTETNINQTGLCYYAKTSNFHIKPYLLTLQKLNMLDRVDSSAEDQSYGSGTAKMWHVTEYGRHFKDLLGIYVNA